jgi:peptidoglycan/LPS O-acetylase OafA/YrhL
MTTIVNDRAQSATQAEAHFGGHLPVLDGIRGLAVLMVLLFHFIGGEQPTNIFERIVIGVTSYGNYGVELFFVLSGFLITGILYDTRDTKHYFRNFFMRRVLRIFPLYYGVLFLVFLVAPLIPAFRGPTLDYLLDRQVWAWLYAVNVYIALQGEWAFSYIQHFWSLAVEEHFYLFWPFVVFALAVSPRRLIAVCLVLASAALLGRLLGAALGVSWWSTYVLTPLRLDGLALGAAMAVYIRQPGGKDHLFRMLPTVAICAGVLLVATFAWTRLVTRDGLQIAMTLRAGTIQVLLACLLVYALSTSARSMAGRFFRSQTMTLLGTYSYGLYVYHHFLSHYMTTHGFVAAATERIGSHTAGVALQALIGIVLSAAVAYVSYEYYERPLLRLKRLFEPAGPVGFGSSDGEPLAGPDSARPQGASTKIARH